MLRLGLETRLTTALTRWADRPAFPLVVAVIALAASVSMTVPFASLLMIAVILSPRRWRSIAVCSSAGAAAGALILYLAFHHLGWARLFAAYPDIVRSSAWADATRWLTHYGAIALFAIAALPLPLTPALMFTAISPLPVAEVIAALWLGKLFKYTAYAFFTAAFPSSFLRHGHVRLSTLGAALGRATAARSERGDR